MEVSGDVARCGPDRGRRPGPRAATRSQARGHVRPRSSWATGRRCRGAQSRRMGHRRKITSSQRFEHGRSGLRIQVGNDKMPGSFERLWVLHCQTVSRNGPVWFLFWFLSCVVEFRNLKHLHPSETGPIWVGQRMALALDAWVASVDSFAQYRKELKPFAAGWHDRKAMVRHVLLTRAIFFYNRSFNKIPLF